VLAIINCLQGFHVDIITSSLVLAKRDAADALNIYKMFDLVVAHNGD